jgi:uncharacterized integral membrane protein
MKTRTLFLLAVLTSIAAFAAVNWNAFTTQATLSLGVASIQAPLGLVMLGVIAFLTALFLVFVLYLQANLLLDARRHAKDLRANRELADKAEASRFTELHAFLEAELRKLSLRDEASQAAMLNRIDQLQRDLQATLKQSENTLSAPMTQQTQRPN